MILNITFYVSIGFVILNVLFVYKQVKTFGSINTIQNVKMITKEKLLILDCIIFILSLIFFYNIYFYNVELPKSRNDKLFICLMVLFIFIILLTLLNVVFLLKNKRDSRSIKINKKQWLLIIIIYCAIICLMEMISKYCKLITDLMWSDWFYGWVFMYMHFMVKICFYTAISPLVCCLSNTVVKK